MKPAPNSDLALAINLAEQAGRYIRTRWNRPVTITHKGAIDLVTEVDIAAERLIVDHLRVQRPDDTIIAEEGQGTLGANHRTWHIDPLDGTTNFSHGLPHFCVSIALIEDQVLQAAAIYAPVLEWTFSAGLGQGAWRNGERIKVSSTQDLNHALLATGFPYDRRTRSNTNIPTADAFLQRIQGLRRAGSAALDLAYVAAGWLDGYWEFGLSSWDIAAGALLVREAGGRITNLDGRDFNLAHGALIASNGHLHQPMLDVMETV